MVSEITTKTKALIDDLKAVCASYGLGNSGDEYKIITQTFLYKYLNDKFAHEVKKLAPKLAKAEDWEQEVAKYSDAQWTRLRPRIGMLFQESALFDSIDVGENVAYGLR